MLDTHKRRKAAAAEQMKEWRTWLDDNAEWTKAAGVPDSVLSDRTHWRDFLEFGLLSPPDFDPRELSIPQKVALLRVISTRPIDMSTPVAVGLVTSILDVMENRV